VETAIGVFASRDGAGAGASIFATSDADAPKPTPDEKCSEDVIFFREVLKEGRSLPVSLK
jgi:hypothetical protein